MSNENQQPVKARSLGARVVVGEEIPPPPPETPKAAPPPETGDDPIVSVRALKTTGMTRVGENWYTFFAGKKTEIRKSAIPHLVEKGVIPPPLEV